MKVLNLYAGIGGNRKLWQNVEVTAVENNPEIAAIYKEYFPDDTVIVGDAHEYLLNHYKEFDFIWSSPPCQTHSRARFWAWRNDNRVPNKYPDMKLYQEILFLKHYFNGKWVVENVTPFYEMLIEGNAKIGRHLFWSNFHIAAASFEDADIHRGSINDYQQLHGFNLAGRKLKNRKDQILRNCVNPELGLYILEQSKSITTGIVNQLKLYA